MHREVLIIDRTAEGLVFRHADGRPYGEVTAPTSIGREDLDIERKVGSALHNLGFRDADVRLALEELRGGAPPVLATEQLLRAALARLGPQRSARR